MGWGFGDTIIQTLSWASLHHLPQGSSYHQNSAKQNEQYVWIHKCRKTNEIWTWSITGSNYNSLASIRSSSTEKLHHDYSVCNSTMSWIPKSKRTLSDFQWSFTRTQKVDGLGVTIFGRRQSCWNSISEQIAVSKDKIKSGAIWMGFHPWAEYQRRGKLSQFSIYYLFSHIQLMV
jgi:hypothetical protein